MKEFTQEFSHPLTLKVAKVKKPEELDSLIRQINVKGKLVVSLKRKKGLLKFREEVLGRAELPLKNLTENTPHEVAAGFAAGIVTITVTIHQAVRLSSRSQSLGGDAFFGSTLGSSFVGGGRANSSHKMEKEKVGFFKKIGNVFTKGASKTGEWTRSSANKLVNKVKIEGDESKQKRFA
jgi:hypothetical protein